MGRVCGNSRKESRISAEPVERVPRILLLFVGSLGNRKGLVEESRSKLSCLGGMPLVSARKADSRFRNGAQLV